jgi:nicotinate-nucleotide--dimethylbenzimidazole phosphoribosyltransferase
MRLGEGTGALLAVPLVQAATRVMGEMKTLEEAGIA